MKIACAFPDGVLTAEWLQSVRLLIEALGREAGRLAGPGARRRTVVRRGFQVMDWPTDVAPADSRQR